MIHLHYYVYFVPISQNVISVEPVSRDIVSPLKTIRGMNMSIPRME